MDQPSKKYNRPELECKRVLEKMFHPSKFEKVRLSTFKNPETGRSLELDLYNADLRLALEYNGAQHYVADHYFNRQARGGFDAQQVRDIFKTEYCRINRITLIEVPNMPLGEIEEFIKKSCIALELPTTPRDVVIEAQPRPTVDEIQPRPAISKEEKRIAGKFGDDCIERCEGNVYRCSVCNISFADRKRHCKSATHLQKFVRSKGFSNKDIIRLLQCMKEKNMSADQVIQSINEYHLVQEYREEIKRLEGIISNLTANINRLREQIPPPRRIIPASPDAIGNFEDFDNRINFEDLRREDFFGERYAPRVIIKALFCNPRQAKNCCLIWGKDDWLLWVKSCDRWMAYVSHCEEYYEFVDEIFRIIWKTQRKIFNIDYFTSVYGARAKRELARFSGCDEEITAGELNFVLGEFWEKNEIFYRIRGFNEQVGADSDKELSD
jgi:DNA-binding transcriptional MerR regulator